MDVITELLISKTVNHEEIVHTVHVMFYLLFTLIFLQPNVPTKMVKPEITYIIETSHED